MLSGRLSRIFFYGFLVIAAALIWLTGVVQETYAQREAPQEGVVLSLKGPVTPSAADYLIREIEAANTRKAALIIIEIDTPGGLVTSMQDIVKSILASDTPVATYVSPQGSQSASAGLYVMYAAHISAMAPATNTGSATPVSLGGDGGTTPDIPDINPTTDENPTGEDLDNIPAYSSEDAMRKKVVNNSAAYIRALAERHGRNAEWAELAVRDAVNVTSEEALELNVIDLIAADMDDLLAQIDGRVVTTNAGDITIATKNITINKVEPKIWERILGFLSSPAVAAILLTLGTTGIIAEIWNPGSIFPGVFGTICLLLAFYANGAISYNWVFISVMGLGALLITMEAYTPSFGIMGFFGIIIFGVGLYFSFPESFRISYTLLFTILGLFASFMAFIVLVILGSRTGGPLLGDEAIKRRKGIVTDWDEDKGEGHVHVEGERWKARSSSPLRHKDEIIVEKVDGLILVVKKATDQGRFEKMLSDRHNRKIQDYVM